jgi:ATP-dependent DNA helicase RecG
MIWNSEYALQQIALGADSARQFKVSIEKASKLAEEMCAFSNSNGGCIMIGVHDDGTIHGLSSEEIGKYNQLISNTANENIKPPIYPRTFNVEVSEKKL